MPTLEIENVKVNYHVSGSGEPVVLLHCSSSTHRQWRDLWKLIESNFQVWAPDLYGYGDTDLWPGGNDTLIAEEAKLVRGLIEHIGKPVHLVGHSFGGVVSLRLAMENRTLLRSLVLIEPIAAWLMENDDDLGPYLELRGIRDEFHGQLDSGDTSAAVRPYYDYWSGEGAWNNTEGSLREYVLATAKKVYLEFAAIYNSGNTILPLDQIKLPTTIIRGSQTPSSTKRITEILSQAWTWAPVHSIPGGGHLSPITHPDEVNNLVKFHLMNAVQAD